MLVEKFVESRRCSDTQLDEPASIAGDQILLIHATVLDTQRCDDGIADIVHAESGRGELQVK
ncbi:MAG: hypothetical protein IPL00_15465 [Gammaproteobacteria bacterium]|nr:hypothetical protein [Gammaproteobacteria bacterium]